MLCGCTFGPRPAGRRPRRLGHRRPEQFHAPHRPLLRHAATARRRALGLSFHRRQLPLAAFHRNDPDNGFTLCFEDRDGQRGLHRFYDTQAEQEKRCQHLTLHLRLEPCDIERLFQIQRLAPASPRRSCSASAAKRSAARSAASRVTTLGRLDPLHLHPSAQRIALRPSFIRADRSRTTPRSLTGCAPRKSAQPSCWSGDAAKPQRPTHSQPHSERRRASRQKQLSMQSDIQITNRNDTCFVDIEGVIGVPVAVRPTLVARSHLRKIPGQPRPAARNRRSGNRRQYPLDGRRRKRRPADLRGPLVARRTHRHPLLRLYGFGCHSHRTGRIGGMPRNIGPRPLPDPQFDLHRRRQCRGTCDPHRPAPQNRRTPGGLCRPFGPHSGGVHPPDGRKQRLRPLALSAGGTRRRTRRSDHRTRHYGKTPAAQATPAGQWRKLLGKLGLVRPADALPRPQHPPFRRPGKGSGLRTSELALHEGQQFAAPTRTLPAKIRRSEKRLPRPTSEPMPKMRSN